MAGCVQSYNAPGDVIYTQTQLEGLWIQAGGPPQAAQIASAIAMAESGGHSTATCVDSDKSTDRGLWQINSSNGSWSTYDVMTNARGAVAISNRGANFRPWTTYTSGAYTQFMKNVGPPDTTAPINGTNAAAGQTAILTSGNSSNCGQWDCLLNPLCKCGGPISGLTDSIRSVMFAILNPIINYVAGALGIAAGGAMIIIGIYFMVSQSSGGGRIRLGAQQEETTETSAEASQGASMFAFMAGPEAGATVAATRVPAIRGTVGPRTSSQMAGATTQARQANRQRTTTKRSVNAEAGTYRRRR